jgi:hypothetical protein
MSGTTGTVYPVSTLLSQFFADSVAAGSITPAVMRDLIVSLQAIAGVTSVAGRTGAVTLTADDISGLASSLPLATTTTVGVVKADGTTITVDSSGKISSVGGGSGAVTSVAGRTGAVTLTHNDLTDWAAATAGFTGGSGNSAILLASTYGVVANGTTDDTAAWGRAFAAATTGQIVFAPPGVSVISSITIPGGVTLMGCHTPGYYVYNGAPTIMNVGSVLQQSSGTTGASAVIMSGVKASNANGVTQTAGAGIKNMGVHANGSNSAIQVGNNTTQGPCYIDNCSITGGTIGIDAVTVNSLGGGYGWYVVSNCSIGGNTVGIKDGVDSRILNCFINGNGSHGIMLESGASDITIAHCKIEWNSGNGIYTTANDGNTITGCNFDANSLANISATNQANLAITGCVFRRGGAAQANNGSINDCQIYISGNDKTTISGCTTRALANGGNPLPSYALAGGSNTAVVLVGNALTGRYTGYLNPTYTPTGLITTGNAT